MKVYTFDFKFCTKWPTILCILIITGIVGYFNQTDIYDKLNALPDDRNELTPIKNIEFSQIGNSNFFNFNLTVKCALKETKDNFFRSMKFLVENDQFSQVGYIHMDRNKYINTDYVAGQFIVHFYGPVNVALMYMYEPIYEKSFNVSISSFMPSNSLISLRGGGNNHLSLSNVCVKDGIIYLFSQDTIKAKQNYQSLAKSEFYFKSEISYNYKDYFLKNPGTVKVSKGNMFISDTKTTKDWFRNIILPLTEHKDDINNTLYNYVFVRSSKNNESLPFKEYTHAAKLSTNLSHCFDKVELYHLEPFIDITKFLSNVNYTEQSHDNLVIFGKEDDFNEETVSILKELTNSADIIYIEHSYRDDKYISFEDRVSLIYNAKYVLTKSDNMDLASLNRGFVFCLSNSQTFTNSDSIHLNPQTKFVHYIQHDLNSPVSKEFTQKVIDYLKQNAKQQKITANEILQTINEQQN